MPIMWLRTAVDVDQSLLWGGIGVHGKMDLHIFQNGPVGEVWCHDEILDPSVRPYAATIGHEFILDDNARPHHARVVDQYLEAKATDCLDCPA